VPKAWTFAAAVVLSLTVAGAAAPAPGSANQQDLTLTMDDGAKIAATLFTPAGSPPAGGWPAIVLMHGLAGNRQQMDALVPSLAGGYVALTFDARGHGDSTGLVSVDGPREVADVRAIETWLAARPDVADDEIGAWGISYGGGAVLNSLVAGVPWAAVATVQTWTDLYAALAPQDLVKSGLVAGLAASIPDERKSTEFKEIQALAFSGQHRGALVKWAAPRSSLSRLHSVKTPVFVAQGRRDFLFGIGQGIAALAELKGPKALWLGLHGHAPSTFPAADTGLLLMDTEGWFACYLRHEGCNTKPPRVTIVPQNFDGNLHGTGIRRLTALPKTTVSLFRLRGAKTIARGGKVVRTTGTLRGPVETLGSPSVRVAVTPQRGWSRLVAVLSGLLPDGSETVVGAGGVPLAGSKPRTVVIRLSDTVTFVPRGSRLRLTLCSSSVAQSTSNLLYLDLPLPEGAKVRLGPAMLSVPRLRAPVTK
jgi:pimeloyl-ACP methyl ester carboxylesterase